VRHPKSLRLSSIRQFTIEQRKEKDAAETGKGINIGRILELISMKTPRPEKLVRY